MKLNIFLFAIVFLVISSCSPKKDAPTDIQVNELPKLMVVNEKGEVNSLHDAGRNAVIIFFNPGCEHCQREATAINNKKESFEDYDLYFLSTGPMQEILQFAVDFKLTDENFHFGQVDLNEVLAIVGPLPSVPAIMVFKDGKFIEKFAGDGNVDKIISIL